MKGYEQELLGFEYKYLVKLLKKTKCNITKCSEQTGLQRHQILRMLKRNRIVIRESVAFGLAELKGPEGWTVFFRDRKCN